jgi:hypothetical protein
MPSRLLRRLTGIGPRIDFTELEEPIRAELFSAERLQSDLGMYRRKARSSAPPSLPATAIEG